VQSLRLLLVKYISKPFAKKGQGYADICNSGAR
jgi:hypothetical protein